MVNYLLVMAVNYHMASSDDGQLMTVNYLMVSSDDGQLPHGF